MKKKSKRMENVLTGVLVAVLLIASGFMGIENFEPVVRHLTITDRSMADEEASSERGSEKLTADGGEESLETAAVSENAEADSADGTGEGSDGNESGENGQSLKIDAKSAVLIDGSSGRVLFAQNEKEHLPPASVTKVMTLLLVLEGCESGKISLDDKVTVSERAASMGGSQMYMEPGEQHTVEELIKGVIMVSANDGCVALSEHLCGSVESFVERMNERARELGLRDSHFVNTNGLPVANHYSCAYDIGVISVELMKFENARPWFTAWQEDIEVGLPGKESKFTLTNTNKLIRSYSGAIGVKTGFTQDAGYCLSGAAQRDSTRLIGVVLGCESSKIRFAEMAKLLDHGFACYETVQFAKKGEKIRKIKTEKGDEMKFYAVTECNAGVTVEKGAKSQMSRKVKLDKGYKLPLKKGSRVGTLEICQGKEKVAEYDLVADRDVDRADFITTYIRLMKKLI